MNYGKIIPNRKILDSTESTKTQKENATINLEKYRKIRDAAEIEYFSLKNKLEILESPRVISEEDEKITVLSRRIKEKKDELKKGLSTYEINSFNRINKLAKDQFGENYKEVVVQELNELEQSGKSLNTLVGKLEKSNQKVGVKSTPKSQPTKGQVIQQLKKVLNQLPVEQHKEVLQSLLQQYDFQMVG